MDMRSTLFGIRFGVRGGVLWSHLGHVHAQLLHVHAGVCTAIDKKEVARWQAPKIGIIGAANARARTAERDANHLALRPAHGNKRRDHGWMISDLPEKFQINSLAEFSRIVFCNEFSTAGVLYVLWPEKPALTKYRSLNEFAATGCEVACLMHNGGSRAGDRGAPAGLERARCGLSLAELHTLLRKLPYILHCLRARVGNGPELQSRAAMIVNDRKASSLSRVVAHQHCHMMGCALQRSATRFRADELGDAFWLFGVN